MLFRSTYLIPNESSWQLYSTEELTLILKCNSKKHSEEIVVAWLKSSFVLWYMLSEHECDNLIDLDVLEHLHIPDFSEDEINRIESTIRQIILLEETFLRDVDKIIDIEVINKLLSDHNYEVTKLGIYIDKVIYEALNLSQLDICYIEKYISSLNKFNYSDILKVCPQEKNSILLE